MYMYEVRQMRYLAGEFELKFRIIKLKTLMDVRESFA